MYFDLIEIEQKKLNKKKVIIVISIILLIILISAFAGIKVAKIKYDKEQMIKQEQLNKEREMIEEQLKIKQQEEAKRLKNSKPLTEEQMNAIDNIYKSDKKSVFLTFDDGPTKAVTPLILDLLKQENVKATFFVLGNRAKANPDLIKREFEEGHYIANHGYTHKYGEIYSSIENVLNEYNYTEGCIKEALGNPEYNSRVFRYPGGSNGGYYNKVKQESKQYLRQNGIVYLDWNSLSKDAEGAKTKEQLLQSVIDTVGQKQSVVILMHDSSDKILTYEILPEIIKYLRDNGYEFKSLYDIL